jgi:hypothetical protein
MDETKNKEFRINPGDLQVTRTTLDLVADEVKYEVNMGNVRAYAYVKLPEHPETVARAVCGLTAIVCANVYELMRPKNLTGITPMYDNQLEQLNRSDAADDTACYLEC